MRISLRHNLIIILYKKISLDWFINKRKSNVYFGFGRVTSAKKLFVSTFLGCWPSFIMCILGSDNKLLCWLPSNDDDDEKPNFDDDDEEEEDDEEDENDDDDENAEDFAEDDCIALILVEADDIDELASFFIRDMDKPAVDDSLFSKLNDSCLEDINFDALWPFAVLLCATKVKKMLIWGKIWYININIQWLILSRNLVKLRKNYDIFG